VISMTGSYVASYFVIDIVCIAIVVIIITKLTSDLGTELEMKAFRGLIIGDIIFIATNALWVWCNYGYIHCVPLAFALSLANVIALSYCAYYWLIYAVLRLNPKWLDSGKLITIARIPIAIIIGLILSSIWTGWIFTYTRDGIYVHGPLYLVQVFIEGAYLIVPALMALYFAVRTRSAARKKECMTMVAVLFSPIAGGVVDSLIPNLPVMELCTLFSIVLVFSNLQESQIYNDALTGLNNRRQADEWLSTKLGSASPRHPIYFFLADADRFKNINDNYGHLEGDRALQIIADAHREVGSVYRCLVARWGGDEFVIIIDGNRLKSPEELASAIKDRLAKKAAENDLPYQLSLGIGYTRCVSPDEGADQLVARADHMMYRSKKKRIGSD
jgi:diguanylate cyclase (GGDEF)-like protein